MLMGAAGRLQSIRVLRVLCREEFSVAAAKTFVDDLKRAMQWLTGHYMYTPEQVHTYPFPSCVPAATPAAMPVTLSAMQWAPSQVLYIRSGIALQKGASLPVSASHSMLVCLHGIDHNTDRGPFHATPALPLICIQGKHPPPGCDAHSRALRRGLYLASWEAAWMCSGFRVVVYSWRI